MKSKKNLISHTNPIETSPGAIQPLGQPKSPRTASLFLFVGFFSSLSGAYLRSSLFRIVFLLVRLTSVRIFTSRFTLRSFNFIFVSSTYVSSIFRSRLT